jgi:hypothetical protein
MPTSPATATINTKTAPRREVQYPTIDDLLRDIDRVIASDRAGALTRTGNWTAGQVFNHLATWIDYGYDGFPPQAHPPFFIRWILRMKKKKFLRDGAPRGVKIPGIEAGTLGTEEMSTEEGAARLRAALMRLKNREPVKFHSPAFGPMSDDERIQFQLRHAECHMGFLNPH